MNELETIFKMFSKIEAGVERAFVNKVHMSTFTHQCTHAGSRIPIQILPSM